MLHSQWLEAIIKICWSWFAKSYWMWPNELAKHQHWGPARWLKLHYKDFWFGYGLMGSSVAGIVCSESVADGIFSLELTTLVQSGYVRLIRWDSDCAMNYQQGAELAECLLIINVCTSELTVTLYSRRIDIWLHSLIIQRNSCDDSYFGDQIWLATATAKQPQLSVTAASTLSDCWPVPASLNVCWTTVLSVTTPSSASIRCRRSPAY